MAEAGRRLGGARAADTGGAGRARRAAGRWWLRHGLGPQLLHWWRRRGLRARVTITAALGLVVAFAAADLLLFNALRVSLTRSVDDYARSGASQVAALIDANRLPDPVPVAAGTITIQVLDSGGVITDVSPDADRMVPVVSVAQARALAAGGGALLIRGAPFDMPSLLRVAAVQADDGQLVIAAVPFSEASGSLNVVARALVIFTPVLFLAFTGAIWLVTGSTLRPIGELRRGAARVTETGVPADLPVPEARDEVRSLALTLNDMLSRLAEAQQRQRALVSDTAHELRSPIASIRTQLEVALDFPDGQDWATTARDVHADVLRLARLTEDLLLLARLDEQAGSEASAARRAPVDLAALCASVACRYADAPVPVSCRRARNGAGDGSGGPVLVAGDFGRLDRLLVNLVDNAVRYAKSSVVVSARRDGAWASSRSPMTARASMRRTGSGCSTGSPGWTARAAGRAPRPAAPGSAWPSSARPLRRTAAPPTWRPPSRRPACGRWSAFRP